MSAVPRGSSIDMSVRGFEQFRDLSKALKQAGSGDLQRNLRRNLRAAGRPTEVALRSAVMRVQVSSSRGGTARPDRSTDLRLRVARAVDTSVTQRGIRVKVNEKKFGPYGKSLPRYLDGSLARYRRWRHPVFGRRDIDWPQQSGSAWFFDTVQSRAGTFQRAVLDAMDETTRELEQ